MYRFEIHGYCGTLFKITYRSIVLAVFLILLLGQTGCKLDTITVGSVDDDVFLKRKNQSLFLKVAGNIGSRKLLLIVHGGPGGNGLDYRDSMIKSNVESKIAVAYWDQRFGGNSQGNGGASDLDSYREDLRVVVQYLKAKYGDDLQIYIMGHSWGGFLTPFFLGHQQNQQLISGWIQVDGAHNYPLNDSLTEDMLLKRANIEIAAGRNESHWQSVLEYCNANNSTDGYDVSLKLNQYAHEAESLMDSVFIPDTRYLTDPSASYRNNVINALATAILAVDRPTYDVNPDSYLSEIKLPSLFLWGAFDFVCPPALCDDLQLKVGSSDKTIQYFYHSGHSPMMNEPELFWNTVLDWIDKH